MILFFGPVCRIWFVCALQLCHLVLDGLLQQVVLLQQILQLLDASSLHFQNLGEVVRCRTIEPVVDKIVLLFFTTTVI